MVSRTDHCIQVAIDMGHAECSMALLVQLLLSLDRRDLAQSIYSQAKRIGNDSTLVQAMEAWIGLKTVSRKGGFSVSLLGFSTAPSIILLLRGALPIALRPNSPRSRISRGRASLAWPRRRGQGGCQRGVAEGGRRQGG